MGTTYNLPNYVGELFSLTPTETPFLSAIGGLSGGKSVASTKFDWQTDDNRDPEDRQRTEGADAPEAENRVRSKVENVTEIHQEAASVSYTKQAATQLLTTPSAAPFTMPGGTNPVGNELDYQVQKAIEAIAQDVNHSFINGHFANPTTNADARKTRGIIEAITTNAIDKSLLSYTDATSATDTITVTHALTVGDKVVFTDNGGADIVVGRVYYVKSVSTTVSFKISATPSGTALTVGTGSGIDLHKPWGTALTSDVVGDLVQSAYDNGGVRNQFTATLWANSTQRRAVSKAYAGDYAKAQPVTRNVGGVVVQVIETDFGTLNIALDRRIPVDMLLFCSMEQLNAVFTNIPGKGAFFEEPLAKTGASDKVQIYGEIGLEYGNEAAHGYLRGLAV
jgi:hypothetical protein